MTVYELLDAIEAMLVDNPSAGDWAADGLVVGDYTIELQHTEEEA